MTLCSVYLFLNTTYGERYLHKNALSSTMLESVGSVF